MLVIRIYFVRGSYVDATIEERLLPNFVEQLAKDWEKCTYLTEKHGINFKFVTSYVVLKPKRKWWQF